MTNTVGRIPKDFIDQLLTRVDIIDVIGSRVPLKKAGREYQACCPFHNEKTASFTVSPTKQFYHCFGCGAHGSAISFLMEYEHLAYPEAIEALARTAGVQVPREGAEDAPKRKPTNKSLYTLMEEATTWFQAQLPQNPAAREYLQQRGLSADIISRFGIGYAPSGWDNLGRKLAAYGEEKLLATGMATQNETGKVYDRFRERIMFPIRDKRGRVIGFGGRVLGNDTPKYLNSPETEIFHKGSELYGLFEARQHTRKLERLLVVEGYMDVIALAQYGITYAVATLGTATTPEHVRLLFRTVPEIIFCFDGDRAGKQAAWRALENALPELQDDKNVGFLFLPNGEDPDSHVRQIGKEAFEASLQKALPLTKFFMIGLNNQLGFRENATLNVTEERTKFVKEAAMLMAKMPNILQKRQLMPELVRMGALDPGQKKIFNQYAKNNAQEAPPIRQSRLNEQTVRRTPMRHAIALLLDYPNLAQEVGNPEQWARYEVAGLDLFLAILEIIEAHPHIQTAALVERFRATEYEAALSRLTSGQFQYPADSDIPLKEFRDCLTQIRRQAQQQQLDKLLQQEQVEGLTAQERNDLLCLLSELHHLPG
ncbi:DNA primase [Thiothrix unzii]|jgi:DNA primase|uniref:DNA primase n=1 Tax=Thiothrix unzii TaxID=111769 RepID=UPI002A36135F|nr:DNA primase [Thiothrix unzii]MDX9989550.1 DNA primase [Thiothrix unzii]